ncbi:MAG: PorP/SprF family type IX secretion system membrane protein [Prevotellaceae bacterium]|jgi:type IX secretion system PorP/SprF family membrane protein|nr:PorP/SprF family type IX secretion system membrane protein [Prevotellaceae bacterium]
MKKYLLLPVLLMAMLCSTTTRLCAQQGVVFTQYIFNGLIINPAYAGYQDVFNASMVYRTQWVGIKSAPTTITLLTDGTLLNGALGVGGHVMNDKVGAQQTMSLFTDYSYRLKIDRDGTRLAFGLSLGVTQMSLDENEIRLNDPNDQILTSGSLHEVIYRPDFNIGVFFDHKRFSAGLSITELWGDFGLVKKNPQLYFTFQTLVPINNNYTLKPALMYKDDFKMQPSVDLNCFLMVKDKVWIGLSWRNGIPFSGRMDKDLKNMIFQTSLNALTFMSQVFISENFYLGYAYDFPLGKINTVSMGSHEVMLGFKMGRKAQRVLTPRYF